MKLKNLWKLLRDKMPRKKTTNVYFDENTEAAIDLYNTATSYEEKQYIYESEIKVPLEKLAKNIIMSFSFMYVPENYQTQKDDLISYLISEVIQNCNSSKGKSFSYLSVSAKNYMINENNYNYNKRKVEFSIDCNNDNDNDDKNINVFEIPDTSKNLEYREDLNLFIDLLVKWLKKNINFIFKRKRSIQVAYAIINIIENRNISMDTSNKKELYILIKEQVKCSSVDISLVLNIFRKIYTKLAKDYEQYGTLDFNKVYYRYGQWKD